MSNFDKAQATNDRSSPDRHSRLLAGYLLNHERGAAFVRNMIRDDIVRFSELGARAYAMDLLEVLISFNRAFPESP